MQRTGWRVGQGKTIRVLLADDNADLLHVMRRYLDRQESLSVCGTVLDANELVAISQAQRPDVVVMDLTMPGKPTLEAVRELVASPARCAVIVFSGMDDPERVHAAMCAGASAYLSKHAPADQLATVIREVVLRSGSHDVSS